jgi:protein subunit release factor A
MQTDLYASENAYICFRYPDRLRNNPSDQIVQDITNHYLRYAQQQNWKSQTLRMSLSSQSDSLNGGLLIDGWIGHSILTDEVERDRIQAAMSQQTSGRQIAIETVIVLSVSDDERKPYQNDVIEERFHAFARGGSSRDDIPTAVRLYHRPTNIVATCLEVTRIYDRSRQHYTLERNRTAAWSLLLYSMRLSQPGIGDS